MRGNASNTQAVPDSLDSLETLRELFKPHQKLPKARMTCLPMVVLAVIAERTVSLVWLAKHPDTDAGTASVYRRFQRFFALCRLRSEAVGWLVPALVPKPDQGWILAMDRTNRQLGRTHVNILVVSVLLGRVGLPVAWLVLPKSTKRGNSNKAHRIAVMENVLSILPAGDIRALTRDREFLEVVVRRPLAEILSCSVMENVEQLRNAIAHSNSMVFAPWSEVIGLVDDIEKCLPLLEESPLDNV